jgi:hypothetical protein
VAIAPVGSGAASAVQDVPFQRAVVLWRVPFGEAALPTAMQAVADMQATPPRLPLGSSG